MDAAATGDAPDLSSVMAQALAIEERASVLQADAKRDAMRFAAVACSCVPWFSWADRTVPQYGCPVHGNIMITPDGTVLLCLTCAT